MGESMLSSLGFDPGIILIFLMALMVFVLLYLVKVSMKMSRFMSKYKIFMRGKDAASLETAFVQKFLDVDHLVEVTKNQSLEIQHLKALLSRTTNKIGIVKYDAFPDVGGKISFALAMLNEENLGVREVEKLVKSLQKGKKPVKPAAKNTDALDLVCEQMEEQMKAALGTKVHVNRKNSKAGRIEIEYYSVEELERIYDLIRSCR